MIGKDVFEIYQAFGRLGRALRERKSSVSIHEISRKWKDLT